ncbi:MAG: PqiC family protein [Planctomycetota bacterium]
MRNFVGAISLGVLAVMAIGGCAASQATRFYVLSGLQESPAATASAEPGSKLGVRVVRFPAYLQRTPIVTRGSRNQLRVAEFHRWAEPVDEGFARQLVENLHYLACAANIHAFPWHPSLKVGNVLIVDVQRFEQQPDGKVILSAFWRMIDDNGNELMPRQRVDVVVPTDGMGYEAVAGAMSKALGEFSKTVAAALRGRT